MVVVWLLERGPLTLLLLAKDLSVVLKLCKPCSLPVNVLSFGFGILNCCLPPCDGFLLLADPLDLLPDHGQLLLLCSFIFEIPFLVFILDLLELDIALDDLYW
jgi:hypothetical protein